MHACMRGSFEFKVPGVAACELAYAPGKNNSGVDLSGLRALLFWSSFSCIRSGEHVQTLVNMRLAQSDGKGNKRRIPMVWERRLCETLPVCCKAVLCHKRFAWVGCGCGVDLGFEA